MNLVKSGFSSLAAGFVALANAQAADLPAKAKPIEYVKVCSLYGAGYSYMPGTDMCLKIGGYVRAEAAWGANANAAGSPLNANLGNRATSNLTVRARGYITADAREQTAYGVARGYISVGVNTSDIGTAASEGPSPVYATRAFVQWAGFTAGLAASFFDFYTAVSHNYRGSYLPTEASTDSGWWVWAYTANLGDGFSASLSAEVRQVNQIIGQSSANVLLNGASITANTLASGAGYGGWQAPDIVGNLRVDQAWGSAQLMAAAHELNPLYYGATETAGHPADQWGWAAGAGLHLNLPVIAPGDNVEGEINYAVGATKYLYNREDTNMNVANGANQAYGVAADCVYGGSISAGNATNCQLTRGWSAIAAYEHYWTPQWHQSFTGAYMQLSYDQGIGSANSILCTLAGNGGGIGTSATATPGCNNNWALWGAGTRLQWDVTRSFYVGVEVIYSQLISASTSDGLIHGYALPTPAAPMFVSNEDNWTFSIRMHKDFESGLP